MTWNRERLEAWCLCTYCAVFCTNWGFGDQPHRRRDEGRLEKYTIVLQLRWLDACI